MLRKKIFTALAMVMIVAMLAASVAGCTFIRENDYRAANQAYATVSHNGITLTISYNEFVDYFNSMGYYYVNYYGYSVEDALDLCISNKIQQKYLITEAMVYLTDPDKVGQSRIDALVSSGSLVRPENVLTQAETLAAIYAVNDSMITSAEEIAEESKQTEYSRLMNAVSSENVAGIELSDETKEYFETFFHAGAGCYVGQKLDTDRVKIVVKYDDGSVSEPFIVPTAQYSTAFTSEATADYTERTEDKEFVITYNESVTGENGEATTEAHTLTYDYTLIYPRETKAEPEEETDYTKVTIGDFDPVSRYAAYSEIPDEIKNACKSINPLDKMREAEEAGDTYMADAWRRVSENINSANKTVSDLYNSQYESAVLSALQAELYNSADRAFNATDSAVAAEYKYLYSTAKDSYTGTPADDKEAFIDAIGEGIDSLYYYPVIDDIGNYYYVYQILFSFTDEQAAFLEELGGDEDAIAEFTELFFKSLTTEASNPDYDPETYDPEDADAETPFGEEELVSDVIVRLESVLTKIYAGTPLTAAADGYDYTAEQLDTPEERSAAAIEVFLDYLYRYNDDPGIFNNAYGYLMTADPADSGWVDAFNELGDAVFKVENAGLGSGTGLVGNAFGADGKLAWRASDYGIHLMMVSATPFKGVTGELTLPATDAEIVAYLKSRTNPDTEESIYDTVARGLRDENRTTVYNAFIEKVPTDLFTRSKKNKLELNDGVKGWLTINAKKIKSEIYDVYLG